MDSDSAKFYGLVHSLRGDIMEQLVPLVDEYMFCKLKIKQLRIKNPHFFAGSAAQQQEIALNAIINENERRLLEVLRSETETPDILQNAQ